MNMKTKIGSILIAAMAVIGCADIQVDEPSVCSTTQAGTVQSGYLLPSQQFSATIDVSGTIQNINNTLNPWTLNVNQLTATCDQDLSWLKKVDVTINGNTPNTPEVPLATYSADSTDPGETITFTLVMDVATLITYLQQPVTLAFTVTGNPTQDAHFTSTICVEIKGTLAKSL